MTQVAKSTFCIQQDPSAGWHAVRDSAGAVVCFGEPSLWFRVYHLWADIRRAVSFVLTREHAGRRREGERVLEAQAGGVMRGLFHELENKPRFICLLRRARGRLDCNIKGASINSEYATQAPPALPIPGAYA